MLNLEYEPSLRRGYQPMCEWENQVKSLLTSDFNLKTDPCVNVFFFLDYKHSHQAVTHILFLCPLASLGWKQDSKKSKISCCGIVSGS